MSTTPSGGSRATTNPPGPPGAGGGRNWSVHIESYTKHLRTEPIDHRLTVGVECGGREVHTLTTDSVERTGCIPCLQNYYARVGIEPTQGEHEMTQQQRHFHLDLQEPHDALRVTQALSQAGIETWEVREVSPNHDGIIITQALGKEIWEHETGQRRCEGHCRNEPGAPQHMTWEELSTEQQQAFTSDIAHFMDAGRLAEYTPERETLDEDDKFDGVALRDCRPTGR